MREIVTRNQTAEYVRLVMSNHGYSPESITTYLADADRGGYACPIGPVTMIAKSPKTGRYSITVEADGDGPLS